MTRHPILARLGEPGRFIVIGLGASAVQIVTVTCLVFAVPSAPVTASNFLAIFVAFFFSFFGHRYFTFSRAGHLPSFLVTAVIGMAINNAVVAGVLHFGGVPLLAVPSGMAIAAVGTFILSKRFAFAGGKDGNVSETGK